MVKVWLTYSLCIFLLLFPVVGMAQKYKTEEEIFKELNKQPTVPFFEISKILSKNLFYPEERFECYGKLYVHFFYKKGKVAKITFEGLKTETKKDEERYQRWKALQITKWLKAFQRLKPAKDKGKLINCQFSTGISDFPPE